MIKEEFVIVGMLKEALESKNLKVSKLKETVDNIEDIVKEYEEKLKRA